MAPTTIVTFLLICIATQSIATTDFKISYQLINEADSSCSHILNVVIPQALIDHYRSLTHKSTTILDFPKFVTPYALKPIANCLREVYPDDEDFANSVPMMVHQIPYEETVEAYYPAETILRNNGDCDLTSVMAASILKAGGLDVVLLFYESEEHMNVGIHLRQPPRNARTPVFFLVNNDVKYYIAETTSANWKNSWRVGECPDDLKNTTVQIVTLEGVEQISPRQVFASFTTLDPTEIKFEVSPMVAFEGSTVTVKGKVTPGVKNENITIYWNQNGKTWQILAIVVTTRDGQFEYTWKPNFGGFLDALEIRVSWTGNQQYAGTVSQIKVVMILSPIVVTGITAVTAIAIVGLIYRNRRKRITPSTPLISPDILEPHTPSH